MILTGKAKEDFLEYLDVEEKWFNEEYIPLFEYALIIEWFDSVGIYCVPNYNFINKNWSCSAKDIYTILYRGCNFNSRQEATRQAIIKANEIYNSKK